MTREEFEALLAKVKADREVSKEIDALGGITHRTVQSDKLGFDWKETVINDTVVMKEYIEQENPVGTEDNPIVYEEGMPLINNAFYIKDGKVYVWMNEWVEWEV